MPAESVQRDLRAYRLLHGSRLVLGKLYVGLIRKTDKGLPVRDAGGATWVNSGL